MSIKHEVRVDGKGTMGVKSFTARTAIRQFCRECFGFKLEEVKSCTDPHCPLFPFRGSGVPKGTV